MAKVQTGARVPAPLAEAVRRFAQENNMTISEVYALAAREFLERNQGQPSIEELAQLVAAYLARESPAVKTS